jgi:hypothetical protein
MNLALLAALLAVAPIHTLDDAGLDRFVRELHAREALFNARLAETVRAAEGTPYADGPLGEGPGAPYDDDPLADFSRVDCVTFVEQTVALAAAPGLDEAVDLLQRIRYRDGVVDFGSRNHFLLADWIPNNPFCTEITGSLGVPTVALTRTIDRRAFFERAGAAELGDGIAPEAVTIRYAAATDAARAAGKMPSPALVVFVGRTDWLFALHCGIFVREGEGPGVVYHASSKAGKVVAEPLEGFFEGDSRYLGFTAHAIGDPLEGAQERDQRDARD